MSQLLNLIQQNTVKAGGHSPISPPSDTVNIHNKDPEGNRGSSAVFKGYSA